MSPYLSPKKERKYTTWKEKNPLYTLSTDGSIDVSPAGSIYLSAIAKAKPAWRMTRSRSEKRSPVGLRLSRSKSPGRFAIASL
jgi:hypothetical protein